MHFYLYAKAKLEIRFEFSLILSQNFKKNFTLLFSPFLEVLLEKCYILLYL